MPYRTIQCDPEIALDYNGVKVYRTYEDDDIEKPERFIFSLDPRVTDSSEMGAFDVRLLHNVAAVRRLTTEAPPAADERMLRRTKVDLEDYLRSPAHLESTLAWTRWWDETVPEIVMDILREAIDAGHFQLCLNSFP